ncbi:MAG: hypothetical protein ACRDGU_07945 [Actinomycetota bacterium]
MRRMGWKLATLLLLVFVPATAAASGGYTFLEFKREHYVPGELARATANIWVDFAWLDENGPFYAYLLPERLSIDPPKIPGEAIPLGSITIARAANGEDSTARATLAFRVPEVSPGAYQVTLCNRPCRDTVVGELAGGSFRVVATAEQARLLNFGARLERRLEQRFWDSTGELWTSIESLQNQTGELERRVSGVAIEAHRSDVVDEDLLSRMDRAESQLVAMQRRITELADEAGWPSQAAPWFGLASGWLAALIVASLWVRSTLGARGLPSVNVEHHPPVDLGDLTRPAEVAGQSAGGLDGGVGGNGFPRRGLTPSVTAASRRAMSLAGRRSRDGTS